MEATHTDTAASASATGDHESSNTQYKGVRKRKWGKWVSEIRLPNSRERIWLGSYDSPRKAARAFDAALYCLRGPLANFNFPHSPLELQIAVSPHHSLSPPQIQELAARFANQDPHPSSAQPPPPSSSPSPSHSHIFHDTTSTSTSDQLDHDWSFLNLLDDFASPSASSTLYSGGLHKIHSGEFYPTSPPPLLIDNLDDNEGDDAFSHQSLCLWNF